MKNKAKAILSLCLLGFGGAFLAGCSTVSSNQSATQAAEVSKDPKLIVAARAEARWQALIDVNMKDAYNYISPAGRKVLSLEVFRARIKPGLWRSAKTNSVTCSEELCEATVLVKYDIRDIKGLEMEMKESWIKEEGNWWYVQKK